MQLYSAKLLGSPGIGTFLDHLVTILSFSSAVFDFSN